MQDYAQININININYTRNELALLARFVSVPHLLLCMCRQQPLPTVHIYAHVLSTTFTYIFVHMSKLAHVHILPDHVILSISY